MKYWLTFASLFQLVAPSLAIAAELKPTTIQAWDAYVRTSEMRMEDRAAGKAPFLWLDEERDLAQRLRAGEVLVEPMGGESPRSVPSGLIHYWIGAVFVPKSSLDDVMAVLDDCQHYKDFYRPMVVKSQLLDQTPGHQKVTLLMVQKALSVTGAVETDDDVNIARVGADRAYSTSTSIRVQEIADFGKPSEHMLPEDQGPGYVWRTFNITRLEQRPRNKPSHTRRRTAFHWQPSKCRRLESSPWRVEHFAGMSGARRRLADYSIPGPRDSHDA